MTAREDDTMPLVLVVDDEWLNRDLLENMLAVYGYNVLATGDGTQALALAEREKPDLILADVRMPDMDGYELCERVGANPATAHIPVILLTGLLITAEVQTRATAAGAFAIVERGDITDGLIACIRRALNSE